MSGQPIRIDRKDILEENSDEEEIVDKQIKLEYFLGSKIPRGMVTVLLNENLTEIAIDDGAKNTPEKKWRYKILLNGELEKLLKKDDKKNSLLEASYLNVASYASFNKHNTVMDFEEMSTKNTGAEYLTLLKGDIDNLGLLMAYGLNKNNTTKEFSSVSRTTTLSHHLKYFFSTYLNGLLENDFCNIHPANPVSQSTSLRQKIGDQYVYTVFAGGDDLMLIVPHSASVKLLKLLNDKFTQFCCDNPEIHISWSLTNFKHDTPIRIVAEFAEKNQDECKSENQQEPENKTPEHKTFYADYNKAMVLMYDSKFKTSLLPDFISLQEQLYSWSFSSFETKKEAPVSIGVLRHLLNSAKLMKDFKEYNDTSKLIWHPVLVHLIKRELQDKAGKFKAPEVEPFFREVLSLTKETEKSKVLHEILHPLVSSIIYLLRNSK